MCVQELRKLPEQVATELAQTEQEIESWTLEAARLSFSIDAFASSMRLDPARVTFSGDLISYHNPVTPSSECDYVLDLARVREILANLKAIQALWNELRKRTNYSNRQPGITVRESREVVRICSTASAPSMPLNQAVTSQTK
jgi:hypothetical protein